MQEIIEYQNNALVIPENMQKELKKLAEFEITKQEMENEEAKIKDAFMQAFEKYGLRRYEDDNVQIVFKNGYTKKSIDKKALSAAYPKIAERFTKVSDCKASVQVSYKND